MVHYLHVCVCELIHICCTFSVGDNKNFIKLDLLPNANASFYNNPLLVAAAGNFAATKAATGNGQQWNEMKFPAANIH